MTPFGYGPVWLGKASTISSRILQRRCAFWLGASGLMRERGEVELAARAALAAQTIERALPLGVEVGVEHQGRVGIDHQPSIVVHLAVELARRPAGMAERQPALLGAPAPPHPLPHPNRPP